MAFVGVTWISPYSPWLIPLLALSILLYPSGGSLVGWIGIGILAWLAWRRLKPIDVDPRGLIRTSADEIMTGAERFVNEFEEMGWTRVGAISADFRRTKIVISCLMSPDRRSFAEVTDVVLAITSVFGTGRTLVSRNSAGSPLLHTALANDVRGAAPSDLALAPRRRCGSSR